MFSYLSSNAKAQFHVDPDPKATEVNKRLVTIQTSENIDLLHFFSYIKVMCRRNKHRNQIHNIDSVGGKSSLVLDNSFG